jgi:hypothetical protein
MARPKKGWAISQKEKHQLQYAKDKEYQKEYQKKYRKVKRCSRS